MKKYIKRNLIRLSGLILITITFIFSPVLGQASVKNDTGQTEFVFNHSSNASSFKFVVAGAEQTVDDTDNEHTPGQLVIPGEADTSSGQKKCMTVCKSWGEDCVINPRTGARNCRRACKRFGEECF